MESLRSLGSRVDEFVAKIVFSGASLGEARVEVALELELLGHGLDHEVGIGDGVGEIGRSGAAGRARPRSARLVAATAGSAV